MGLRVTRHLGSRSTPADDAKVLAIVPLFPGESVANVHISAYMASGDDSAIDQPSECNWEGIALPWQMVDNMSAYFDEAQADFSTVAAYDELFLECLRGATDEYYGGDVDADPENEATEEEPADEEAIDSGAIGIYRWFNREVLMRPYAAEGNTIIRFGDDFEANVSGAKFRNFPLGQLVLFGMVRYEHAAETNFNMELDDGDSLRGAGILKMGDYPRAQALIDGNTAALGDWIRTILFGGDHYAEADTLKGAAAKSHVKMRFAINSPFSARRRF